MRAKDVPYWRDVKKLSFDEKARIASRLAKRANSRLKALETSGESKRSKAYIQTTENSLSLNYKNRFYQGKKYSSEKNLDRALQDQINFLKEESSTVSGSKSKRAYIKRKEDYDIVVQKITEKDVPKLERWAKQANRNMRELEKAGFTKNAYEYAKFYTEKHKMKFPTNFKKMTRAERESWAWKLTDFLKMKTSTVAGNIAVHKSRVESLRANGLKIKDENIDAFFEFLRDLQYEQLNKIYDSEQIMESLVELQNQGKTMKQIENAFEKVLQDKYTLEQTLEKKHSRVMFK